MLIQSIRDPIKIPTIFNQINPNSLNGVILQSDQRLVISIYKPYWASSESYTFTLLQNKDSFQQFIVILIAVCSSVTVLAVVTFVVYLVYNKRRRRR